MNTLLVCCNFVLLSCTKLSNRTTAVLPQENKTRFLAGIPLTLSFSDKDYDRSQCGLPVESGAKYLN